MKNGLGELFGGNNALLTLLPMLLGGKGGSGDLSKILSLLTSSGDNPLAALGGMKSGSTEGDFPPLFGANGGNKPDLSMLAPLLGGLGKGGVPPVSTSSETPQKEAYPYELQYNRPKKVE